MAALDKVRPKKSRQSRVTPFKVAATTEIFGGGIVLVNATGFAVPGEAGVTGVVSGVAEESVNNTGADGAKTVGVRGSVEYEEFLFANDTVAPVAQAHVGSDCYVLDDQTVTSDSNTNANMVAGTVIEVSTAGVWVRFKL